MSIICTVAEGQKQRRVGKAVLRFCDMSSTPSSQRGYTSAMRIVALVSLLGLVTAGRGITAFATMDAGLLSLETAFACLWCKCCWAPHAGSYGPSCIDNIRTGINIKGGTVINDGRPDKTTNDYDCCRKCQARGECKFWTRVQYNTPEGSEEGECWLRSSIGEKIEEDWAYTSGSRLGASVSDSCIIQKGVEYKGYYTLNDGKKDITNSDWECCQKCAQRSDCEYWTRVQYDTSKGSKKGECWLRQINEFAYSHRWEFNSGSKKDWVSKSTYLQ